MTESRDGKADKQVVPMACSLGFSISVLKQKKQDSNLQLEALEARNLPLIYFSLCDSK